MSHTHTPSEWAAFLSLGVSFWASCAAAIWLFADADLVDFDPRPPVRRAIESGQLDSLLIAVANVRLAARTVARDIACTGAALLILTNPTEVKG